LVTAPLAARTVASCELKAPREISAKAMAILFFMILLAVDLPS